MGLDEHAGGPAEPLTTLEDLPDHVGRALLRGFASGHWWLEEEQAGGTDLDERALADGAGLGHAVSMLLSADLADYADDKAHYDEVADALGARYGRGLVVRSDELGPGRPGPGFRRSASPDSEAGPR